MPGMGPPPKNPEHRARRNAAPGMTLLPAEGRPGAAPTWPLGVDLSLEVEIEMGKAALMTAEAEWHEATTARAKAAIKKRIGNAQRSLAKAQAMKKLQRREEQKLWRDLWKTPQATQWEKLAWTREVAQYVRHKIKAEAGSLDDAKESRQLADRLGLSPLSLLRLRWQIADKAAAASAPAPRSRRNSSKYRDLKVVS